jgi:hypothetical protein
MPSGQWIIEAFFSVSVLLWQVFLHSYEREKKKKYSVKKYGPVKKKEKIISII